MKGLKGERIGLTDGTSSRYLRANRSILVTSLTGMQQSSTSSEGDRTHALQGRLEELLVFEILKDGGTDYRRFTVRHLHKYVLSAIKNAAIEQHAPDPTPDGTWQGSFRKRSREDRVDSDEFEKSVLKSIDESQPVRSKSEESDNIPDECRPDMAYRKKLGGFLHPRDMRRLVTPFSASNEPQLIVRRHAMLVNFDPLRAIVLRDRLLVLVPDGADSILVQLEKKVRGSMQASKFEGTPTVTGSGSAVSLTELVAGKEASDGMGAKWNSDDGTAPETVIDGENVDYSKIPNERTSSSTYFIDNEWEELDGKDWIDLPFELQCVDAILGSVCSILADDVLDLQLAANAMISDVLNPRADVGDRAQEVLRTLKNSVKEMMSRVEGFCRALDLMLEDYEDMALMNLSRLLTHPERFVQPVPQSILEAESDEPELILEAHLQHGHTLTNALTLVQGQILTTEEYAIRKSDILRNRLLYLNMLISVFSLAVALGSFVGSIFGMNVINYQEDSPTAFRTIILSTTFGGVLFTLFILGVIQWAGSRY